MGAAEVLKPLRVVELKREVAAGVRVYPEYRWISLEESGTPSAILSRERGVRIEFLPHSEELFRELMQLPKGGQESLITVSDKLLQYDGCDLAEVLGGMEKAAFRQWALRVPKTAPDPEGVGAAQVSYFRNAFATEPYRRRRTVSIDGFLYGIHSGEWREEVEAVRGHETREARNEAKRSVPAVSPSCRFTGRRGFAYIEERSGFLNLDLDDKDNPGISEPAVRARLYSDPLVYAGHVSVSGKGLSLYIRIADPEQHREAFVQLEIHFLKKWNVQVDKACKDITRLRFVSYDPELYLNTEALVFTPIQPKSKKAPRLSGRGRGPKARKVEAVLKRMAERKQDITGDYADWLRIGYAFSGEFGESGRGYFHEVSQYYGRYDPAETDRQFSACLSAGKNDVTLGTFFFLVKKGGAFITTKQKT